MTHKCILYVKCIYSRSVSVPGRRRLGRRERRLARTAESTAVVADDLDADRAASDGRRRRTTATAPPSDSSSRFVPAAGESARRRTELAASWVRSASLLTKPGMASCRSRFRVDVRIRTLRRSPARSNGKKNERDDIKTTKQKLKKKSSSDGWTPIGPEGNLGKFYRTVKKGSHCNSQLSLVHSPYIFSISMQMPCWYTVKPWYNVSLGTAISQRYDEEIYKEAYREWPENLNIISRDNFI